MNLSYHQFLNVNPEPGFSPEICWYNQESGLPGEKIRTFQVPGTVVRMTMHHYYFLQKEQAMPRSFYMAL